MLAEIALANAAFGAIKQALSNGKELYEVGGEAKKYFDSKSAIHKRVAQKGKTDLDAFMALEKIKEQEEWLKDYMVYAGRAGMWADWLQFQSKCKRDRDKEERLRIAKRRNTIKLLTQFITVIGIAVAVVPVIIYAIMFMVRR